MSSYVMKDEKEKDQEAEDRKIDRRYHWFIFMFIVVLGLTLLALGLSYFNGALQKDEGFFGLDDTIKNIVWTVFTALFIFWALLVSIIRVREAYYEAEDYKAFAKLSVIQFFYLWAALLILIFVLTAAAVMFLFPNSSEANPERRTDFGFTVGQNILFGISPFFVFYLLAFFSYCYLVFMLSFGYVKDLEIFESRKGSEGSEQIKSIEIGIKRILERLDGGKDYSLPLDQRVFSGVQSNPLPAVSNSAIVRAAADSLKGSQDRARSLFSPASRPNAGMSNPFTQSQPIVQNSPLQSPPVYAPNPQSQTMHQVSPVSQSFPLPPGQPMHQNTPSGFVPPNSLTGVGSDPALDPRLGYHALPVSQLQNSYYNTAPGAPSRASQEWMANSLNTLSLPQPVRGVNSAGERSQSNQFGVPPRTAASGSSSSSDGSWDELLGNNSLNSLRGRRRIR